MSNVIIPTRHSMHKKIGTGKVCILVFVNELNDFWINFFQRFAVNFPNLEITLVIKNQSLLELVDKSQNFPFIFALDLSENGGKIRGFGNRYVDIAKKIIVGKNLQKIEELDDKFAKWFSTNHEFSTLQIGFDHKDFYKIIESLFHYFNGE